jgi:hypothetical protein
MKSSLNQKDREILFKNQYTDLGFGTHSDDYVQALLYDTNDNLIETSIVESSDYSIEDGSVKLKTGTIIRKLGFDRGRYKIKYNFLRKKAGSFETILVDGSNQVYDGPFHVMENGYIMKGEEHVDGAERLYLKENKYIVQEVSPTRNEVRIIGQNIDDKKYIDDLFYSGKQRKKENVNFNVKFVTANPGGSGETLKDSQVLQASSDVPQSYVGGLIYLNNAFIEDTIFPEPEPDPSTVPEGETVGDIQARWIVSDTSQTRITGGNLNAINTSWNEFKDSDVQELKNSYERGSRRIPFPTPIFTSPSEIKLKSISTLPSEGGLVKYTWTLSGRDFRSDRRGSFQNNIGPGTDDISIVEAGVGQTQYVVESTNGSEISVRFNSGNMEASVTLRIEAKLANGDDVVSEVYLPNSLRTKK